MGGRPVLFLSYAGVLGGAERVLLDCATRLDRPAVVACPEGPLAAAARSAGLAVEPIPDRSLRMRGARAGAAAALAGLARDARRAARRHEPAVVAAWSARAVLACAPRSAGGRARRPPRPAAVGRRRRRGAARDPRAAARRRRLARDRRATCARRGVTVLHPGVDLARFAPAPRRRPSRRTRSCSARWSRWKRVDLALEVAARIPELRLTRGRRPLPGDAGDYAAALRRRAARTTCAAV